MCLFKYDTQSFISACDLFLCYLTTNIATAMAQEGYH